MLAALAAGILAAAPTAQAQFGGAAPTTPVRDPAALKPPAGARVAIIEFEDMECPDCANANPLLREAAAKYSIPWVRHDFPLPFHPWSFQAAVNARWFDTKSKKLGDDYRDAVFAAQPSIMGMDGLRQFTENFAKAHNKHTPTIWVTTSNSKGAPFIEVVDRTKLYQLIDQAIADTKSAPVKTAKK
jgi:hypothetical protein